MGQQGRLDLGGVDILERRTAVPNYAGVDLRRCDHRQQREGSAHAKARDPYFAAACFQELNGAANILRRRVAKIEGRR